MAITEIAGWMGVASYLLAYLLLSIGRLPANGYRFQGLNAAGAGGLIIHSLHTADWPSVAVNAAWLAIAATIIIRTAWQRRRF